MAGARTGEPSELEKMCTAAVNNTRGHMSRLRDMVRNNMVGHG